MSTTTATNEHVNSQGVTIKSEVIEGVTYLGRGEFYSALKTNDTVKVERTTYTHTNGHSNVSLAATKGGAWLSVRESDLRF